MNPLQRLCPMSSLASNISCAMWDDNPLERAHYDLVDTNNPQCIGSMWNNVI